MIPHQYHIAQEPWISVRTVRVALAVLAYAEQPGNVLDANLTPYSLMRVRKGEAFLPPAKILTIFVQQNGSRTAVED
jgi:hypothetical protein